MALRMGALYDALRKAGVPEADAAAAAEELADRLRHNRTRGFGFLLAGYGLMLMAFGYMLRVVLP